VRRGLIEARNHADGLIHTTERSLAEAGDKVSAGERETVESAIQALKDVLGGDDTGQITAKTEALTEVAMKMGEALYKAQADAGGGDPGGSHGGPHGGAGGGGTGGDKVVDADFEEVDDQKKRGSA
jgi:molecular chaperone DnaK